MTGITLNVTLDDKAILAALAKLTQRGGNLRPALHEIGEHLLASTEDRFVEQSDPQGRPWARLSPGYKKRKRKHQDLMLVLDGYLKGTLAVRVTAERVEIGSNRVYAATHQLGDEGRNIPARPFLGLSAQDKAEVVAIIGDHLAP